MIMRDNSVSDHCDNYFISELRRIIRWDHKVFSFGIGHNEWGHYMKVWESDNNITSSIIIPSGNNGWELFRTTLAEIYKTSKVLCPPPQTSLDAQVEYVTSEKSTQNSSESPMNIETSQNREVRLGESRMMRAGSKRFFFDIGSNRRGHFLKISEVMGENRFSIIVPLLVEQFHEMVVIFSSAVMN